MQSLKRSRSTIKAEAVYRKLMLRYLHKTLDLLLVTEYPKSGASWLCQLLSEYSDIDFPRQRFPGLKRSIMHGHYLSETVRGPTIVFWSDPRDVMVSWYYHCLFKTDKNNHKFVDHIRATLGFANVANISENLPKFILYCFNVSRTPKFNLNQFYDCWYAKENVVHSSYEVLQENPFGEFGRVCDLLDLPKREDSEVEGIIRNNSFSSQTNRSPGNESKSSYLRKGIVGDWQNHFNEESLDVLRECMEGRLEVVIEKNV